VTIEPEPDSCPDGCTCPLCADPPPDQPAYGHGPALCLTLAHGRRVGSRLVAIGYSGQAREMLGYHITKYLHALEFGYPCDSETAIEILDVLDLKELIP